ncbi:MAG: ferredoxin--NADP reductase [Gemmataceae bacterium]
MTTEQIAELRRSKYNATVVSLRKIHSDLMIMRVKPDFVRPAHRPGQYTVLGLGYWEPRFPGCQEEIPKPGEESKLARRSYSISCSILNDSGRLMELSHNDWLEFYIVLVRTTETGQAPALTPRLFLLQEGDRVHLGEKITGNYNLEGVKPDDAIIFLSTGTGEAPHNYMLWELLGRNHQGPIVSACCVRMKKDLGYFDTHQELARRHANYQYLPLTTREETESQGKKYIQDVITSGELENRLGRKLDPDHCHVFLCGNPKMIGVPEKDRETGTLTYPRPMGVIEILTGRGFRTDQPAQKIRGNIHFEEYW